MEQGNLQVGVKKDGILVTPEVSVPPLDEWGKLFEEAKKKGFDPAKDVNEFADRDITLSDM